MITITASGCCFLTSARSCRPSMPGIFRSTSRIGPGLRPHRLQGGGPVGGDAARVAVLVQPARQRLAHDLLVVHDQDPRTWRSCRLQSRSAASLGEPDPAVRAQAAALGVDVAHRRRPRHHAARVFAVEQPEEMADLVHRFLDHAPRHPRRRRRFAQARRRDDRGPPAELRFAEDEGQDRDEEVDVGDGQGLAVAGRRAPAASGGSPSTSAGRAADPASPTAGPPRTGRSRARRSTLASCAAIPRSRSGGSARSPIQLTAISVK